MAILAQIDNPDRTPVAAELERRPIKALGRHILVRDIYGDGLPWTLLVNPESIRMSWDYLKAGNCALSVQHDDGIIEEAPAQQVMPPIGIIEKVDLQDNTFVTTAAFSGIGRGAEMLGLVDEGVLAGASPRLEIKSIQVLDEAHRLGFVAEADLMNLSLVATPDDPNLVVTMAHPGGVLLAASSAGNAAAIGTEVAAGAGEKPEARMGAEGDEEEEGRDKDGENHDKTETRMSAAEQPPEVIMPEATIETTEAQQAAAAAEAERVAGLERERALLELGYQQGVNRDVTMSAIKDGKSREEFAVQLLSEKYSGINYAPMLGQSKEHRPIRMGRLIAHMMAPQDKNIREQAAVEIAVMTEHNGGELDLSHVGGGLRGVGENTVMFALPTKDEWTSEMIRRGQVRMAETSTGNAAAIGTDVAFDMASPYPMDPGVDPILRRCYIRDGLMYNVQYPVTDGGIDMTWNAEGGPASEDNSTVQPKTLEPKELSTTVPINRQAQVRTGGWAYENEMATLAVARREELLKSVMGLATPRTPAPNGLKQLVAAPANPTGNDWDKIRAGTVDWKPSDANKQLSYRLFTDLAAKVTKSKASYDSRLYIMDVDTMADAASRPRFQYGDRGIVDPMMGPDGALVAYAYNAPAVETTLTDDGIIYYGHMASVNIGLWGNVLIWLDTISSTNKIFLRHFELADVSIARGAFFSKATRDNT